MRFAIGEVIPDVCSYCQMSRKQSARKTKLSYPSVLTAKSDKSSAKNTMNILTVTFIAFQR